MAATQLDVISQLAQLLGGTKQTGTADTTALRQVLGQMQQQSSPEGQAAQLQGLFQQAAGQIPGFQAAYSNAVGARRGGNSAVQAALNKLLSQTTIAAQTQQSANLNNQAQAAAALANATRGQTTKTNLGGAAGNLLLLQGLSKGKKLLGEMDLFGGNNDTVTPSQVSPSADMNLSGSIEQGNGLDFNSVPGASFDINNLLGGAPEFDLGLGGVDFSSANTDLSGADFGGGGLMDDLLSMGVFADGGLVGRDGQATDEEDAEAKVQMRYDAGHTNNVALDVLRILMPAFADGGSVTLQAGGGRKSTARTINTAMPTPMLAVNEPAASQPSVALQVVPGVALSDLDNLDGSGGEANMDASGYETNALAEGIRSFAANPIAKILMGLALPGIGPVMGLAGLPENASAEQALGTLAKPVAGAVIGDMAGGLSPAESLATGALLDSVIGGSGGGYGRGSFNGFGDSRGFGSAANTTGGSGFGGGMSGGVNAANGGKIRGPGTGTSDSIPAMLSNGEYVISKDVVDAVGVDFFDALQKSLHTPVATRRS